MSTELAVTNSKQLQEYLGKSRQALINALPKHLNADRMIRLAQTAYSTTPALRKCTPQSILASLVVSSQLGLEPGVAGQSYLIPYGTTCTLVPGWQGLVGLLNNTGRATAWTGAVYDGDLWEFELGSNPKCRHVPGHNYGDPDALRWVYACGRVNGSEQSVIEAWPVERVLKHRDKFNKVGQRHYSYNNFEMYARKVVLLQVLKYMPRSIELNGAITAADAAEMGRSTTVDNGVVIEVDTGESGSGEAPKFAATPQKVTTAKQAVVQEAAPQEGGMNLPKAIRGLLAGSGLTEDAFLAYLKSGLALFSSCHTLEQAVAADPTTLRKMTESWGEVEKEMKA